MPKKGSWGKLFKKRPRLSLFQSSSEITKVGFGKKMVPNQKKGGMEMGQTLARLSHVEV